MQAPLASDRFSGRPGWDRAKGGMAGRRPEMADSIGIAVMGASGRMGRMLIDTISGTDRAHLIAVTEREGHDWIGRDLGEVLGRGKMGVPVFDDPLDAIVKAQAVIDFTSPEATLAHAQLTAQARCVHVIGTTGFGDDDIAALDAAARHATIIRAGNMSLGVNLLTRLVQQIASALDAEFDIEVVEKHHRHKVDAPSGTALMLGEAAAQGRGVSLADVAERGRDGITGPRGEGAIGFSAIRGGDIVGEHDVIFAGPGERITVSHMATDRGIFARGAVKAALWGQGKPPGHYSMASVLGLSPLERDAS
jgi:4-hydroxy-tetrahydrodipicolinate reductase